LADGIRRVSPVALSHRRRKHPRTIELEALSEDENKPLPVRCIATNTDDKSTAEAWMTREMSRALCGFATGNETSTVDYWMQQLEDHRYVDLIAPHQDAKVPVRYIFNAPELLRFGFAQEDLRP